MTADFDVIVVGGGPAGSSCATFCAMAGLRTLIVERNFFPREKVCGDCVNPGCWPVLDRLGVSEMVLAATHSKLAEVEFIGLRGRSVRLPLDGSKRGEIAIKRSIFDEILLKRAIICGSEVAQGEPVTAVESGWKVRVGKKEFTGRNLVGADGRNSTVARLLGLAPAAARDRVALQAHLAEPANFQERVTLRLLPQGYCGVASIGAGLVNVCLVSSPRKMAAVKNWADDEFHTSTDEPWRTMAPLARRPIYSSRRNLFFIGDAARVVEPFTGEGIYYAMASGEIAARHILHGSPVEDFAREHAALYRNRLWINQLAKAAVLHPILGTLALDIARFRPSLLRFLTGKVLGGSS